MSDEDENPKERLWRVRFVMSRVVEIRGNMTAAEAEEKARDKVLFEDEPPVNREDIDEIQTVWVNEEVDLEHLDGCYGNHCWHYGCETGEGAEDYHAYCANCDPC